VGEKGGKWSREGGERIFFTLHFIFYNISHSFYPF
jgi:hypothetical protein